MSMVSTPSRLRLASVARWTWPREVPVPLGPSPVGLASLVATTHQSRFAAMARPTTSSDRPAL